MLLCQGRFGVKGQILFLEKSKLILDSFGIDEVRRVLYFGDSLCVLLFVLIMYLIYPLFFIYICIKKKILCLKSLWVEKVRFLSPKMIGKTLDNKEHKAHTVVLLMKNPLVSIGVGEGP